MIIVQLLTVIITIMNKISAGIIIRNDKLSSMKHLNSDKKKFWNFESEESLM